MDLDSRPGLVMMPTVCTDRPRQIRKAQRATRDALIELAGERRPSEVWFAQYHGVDAARNALRNLGIDAEPTPAGPPRPGAHLPHPARRARGARRRRLRGHQ